MADPWYGSAPPDTPVSTTMPYRVAMHVLTAIVREAKRITVTFDGEDREKRLKDLAHASQILGDAIAAPPHRRFFFDPKPPPRSKRTVAARAARQR